MCHLFPLMDVFQAKKPIDIRTLLTSNFNAGGGGGGIHGIFSQRTICNNKLNAN